MQPGIHGHCFSIAGGADPSGLPASDTHPRRVAHPRKCRSNHGPLRSVAVRRLSAGSSERSRDQHACQILRALSLAQSPTLHTSTAFARRAGIVWTLAREPPADVALHHASQTVTAAAEGRTEEEPRCDLSDTIAPQVV